MLINDRALVLAELSRGAARWGLPPRLPLACAIAESGLEPEAERWGDRTGDARAAFLAADWSGLAGVMVDLQVRGLQFDISFGLGQQSWRYAAESDGTYTTENLGRVREFYCSEPYRAVDVMCRNLRAKLSIDCPPPRRASDEDVLRALYRYNWPGGGGQPASSGVAASYRGGLAAAERILGMPTAAEPWATITSAGRTQLGKPYVWGGHSPETSFDCSGFASWCYRQGGLGLTAFTDAAYGQTRPLPEGQARAGDLLFYRYADASQPGVAFPHMGLWTGPGRTLDCSSGHGVSERATPGLPWELRRHSAL
jgi:hypothetical protein